MFKPHRQIRARLHARKIGGSPSGISAISLIWMTLVVLAAVAAFLAARQALITDKQSAKNIPNSVLLQKDRSDWSKENSLITAEIDQIIESKRPAEIGDRYCIAIGNRGKTIYANGINDPLRPASSVKVLTALAVLKKFGTEHQFQTSIKAQRVTDGVVIGPLLLQGGGDPYLATDDFAFLNSGEFSEHSSIDELAKAIKSSGVNSIPEGIVVDDTLFDDQRTIPGWSPTYRSTQVVGAIGALTINGAKPLGDPAISAGQLLSQSLRDNGVIVGQLPVVKNTSDALKTAPQIAQIKSPEISKIVQQMLSTSDNTAAEILTKHLGSASNGKGTTESGVAEIKAELGKAGVDTVALSLVDGSGLHIENKARCATLMQTLLVPETSEIIRDGLPISGETGTLLDRMTGMKGRVRAKTGTLASTTSLSGWSLGSDNTNRAFVIIDNDLPIEAGRQWQDAIAMGLAEVG